MAADHECPAPGCKRRVPYEMLACRVHYRLLPNPIRNRLYRTWRDGDGAGSPEHAAAIEACIEFWRDS